MIYTYDYPCEQRGISTLKTIALVSLLIEGTVNRDLMFLLHLGKQYQYDVCGEL